MLHYLLYSEQQLVDYNRTNVCSGGYGKKKLDNILDSIGVPGYQTDHEKSYPYTV